MLHNTELEQCFPALTAGNYELTSPKDEKYNCVAWAVGDTSNFWDDVSIKGYRIKGYYWPQGVSADTLDGWKRVFELHGYSECNSNAFDSEFEKIAIYVDTDGNPSHVARQTETGEWTSKLGKGFDIRHKTLDALEGHEGDEYGKVAVIMQRQCKGGQRTRPIP